MTWKKKSPSSEFDNPKNQPTMPAKPSAISRESRVHGKAAGRKMQIAAMLHKGRKRQAR